MDDLRHTALAAGLGEAELQHVARVMEPMLVPSGQTICKQGDLDQDMFVIARGRVRITVECDGNSSLVNYLGPGDHFGELSLLTGAPRSATVTAAMDTDLLKLRREAFQQVIAMAPYFGLNLSRSLGAWLRGMMTGKRQRHVPAVVGLAAATPRTRALLRPLAEALAQAGVKFRILADRPAEWPVDGSQHVCPLPEPEVGMDRAAVARDHLAQALEQRDRALIVLSQQAPDLAQLLKPCDEVWWLVEMNDFERARARLQALLQVEPALVPCTHLLWVRHDSEPLPPSISPSLGIAEPAFHVTIRGDVDHPVFHQQRDLARLVHRLKRIRVGLALGGGGARGLAHVGVLRALERDGFFVDMLSGTSIGSIVGLGYAVGHSPDAILELFKRDLVPGARWRLLPGGWRWYLMWMYRAGGWERLLRRILPSCLLESLPTPLYVVCADLVTGTLVVRDRGDAVAAVLQSINLPVIARPILRDGQALVDGGVLNNLPSDVLHQHQADLVVVVDVASQLAQEFAGNQPTTPAERMRRPGFLETVLRVIEIQQYELQAVRQHDFDITIVPQTGRFGFADFSRAAELAEVGEAAAEKVLPELRRALAELDRRATIP
jgi:NTE family protein